MSNLLDKLLEQAKGKVLGAAEDGKWFDSLTDSLEEQVGGMASGTTKDAAEAALSKLKDHKDDLTHLGKESLTVLMTYMATDNNSKAEEIYLREVATADDLTNELLKDARVLVEERKLRDERIAKFKEIALDVAVAGAKALLPLMLMAI